MAAVVHGVGRCLCRPRCGIGRKRRNRGGVNLEITDGTFAFDSSGTSSFTPLVGPTTTYFELVTAGFSFSNTLPSSSESFDYQGTANIDVNGGSGGGGVSFAFSADFGKTSLDSILAAVPDAMAAFNLVNLLAAAPSGTTTFMTSVGDFAFSYAYVINSLTSTGATGSLNLWSQTNFNGAGNPGGLVFPASANFAGQFGFTASVPEPSTLALFGLGILAIGFRGRRKKSLMAG